MQQLLFHEKWEKALSKEDRILIEEIFHQSRGKEDLALQNIRVARNYQQDILASVLIENRTGKRVSLPFTLLYYEKSCKVAEYYFADYDLDVPPYTSMPWTFIFPADHVLNEPNLSEWHLELKKT
ncbi:SLAP domain-containing protein [Scopulibacillus cellulosilyticus]|uniref:SLAP domain-containing protein n=1 Tax=Scopulibacillus cellulosilyticus TaxID=2665665 RepID=A0ABW2PUH8_9BACL